MKKSLISSHFAHHRPRDKLVTYYLCQNSRCQAFYKVHAIYVHLRPAIYLLRGVV